MAEDIILICIIVIPIFALAVLAVALVRGAKKKIRQQRGDATAKSEASDDNADLLEQLAYYRQQYHKRQITLELYEAHEREIAAKLKEKRERENRQS